MKSCLNRHVLCEVIAGGTFWDPVWKRSAPWFSHGRFLIAFSKSSSAACAPPCKELKSFGQRQHWFYGSPHRTGMMTAAPPISNLVAALNGS